MHGFLNQDCVLVHDFESIFPGAPLKIVFQQYRPIADIRLAMIYLLNAPVVGANRKPLANRQEREKAVRDFVNDVIRTEGKEIILVSVVRR